MIVAVAPRVAITPAPTPAPVTAAPITPAPILPTIEAPVTAAPVTVAPVTAAPVVPTAPTSQLEIFWDLPEEDQLPPQELVLGDSIIFVWNGVSNVYIHPSGNCSEEGSIFVGNESGTVYTFESTNNPKNITFASQIGAHCEKGQILQVAVGVEINNNGTIFVVPCFSGDALVQVENQGSVAMSSLEIGDSVLVAGDKYEPVYSFGHRSTESVAEFLQIYSDGAAVAPIEISSDHLILSHGEHWVPAGILQAGDKLVDADGNSVSITKIQRVNRKGVFAPFTKSGSIVVNDLVASNYIGYQGSEYLMVGGVQTPLTYHWVAHIFNSVHRIAVTLGVAGETYTDTGVSRWVDAPHKCGSWLLRQHPVVMVTILLPLTVVFTMITLLEQSPMWVFTLMVALVVSRGFKLKKGKAT
jgi:hypothetical protein